MEQTLAEKDLATKLFGKTKTRDLEHMIAPFPLILHCYKAKEGFVGDDLGMFAKACNEFFPAPTDKGICLTKNMDMHRVVETKKDLIICSILIYKNSMNMSQEEH